MLLSLIHSKSDSQCQWSALLTLFVIASRFSIPHSLHHGSSLSCFTSFLIFLPQQCVRGLCCGCKQGRGMCTFRGLENKPRTPTVTSNRLCVCLGPALPRPASSNHLAELWKLVFPPSLPGWDCLQEVVLSFPVAGRKVVCKLSHLLHIHCCAGGHPCPHGGTVGGMADAPWQHLQVLGSLTWSRSLHRGEEGPWGRMQNAGGRMQFRSCCQSRHLCSCVLGSARAGAAGRKSAKQQKHWVPYSWQLVPVQQPREQRRSGWLEDGGTTPALSQQKAVLKLRVLTQGEQNCIGARGREWQPMRPAARGEWGPHPFPSSVQADPA